MAAPLLAIISIIPRRCETACGSLLGGSEAELIRVHLEIKVLRSPSLSADTVTSLLSEDGGECSEKEQMFFGKFWCFIAT